jgi:hypothetical protein
LSYALCSRCEQPCRAPALLAAGCWLLSFAPRHRPHSRHPLAAHSPPTRRPLTSRPTSTFARRSAQRHTSPLTGLPRLLAYPPSHPNHTPGSGNHKQSSEPPRSPPCTLCLACLPVPRPRPGQLHPAPLLWVTLQPPRLSVNSLLPTPPTLLPCYPLALPSFTLCPPLPQGCPADSILASPRPVFLLLCLLCKSSHPSLQNAGRDMRHSVLPTHAHFQVLAFALNQSCLSPDHTLPLPRSVANSLLLSELRWATPPTRLVGHRHSKSP